MTENTKHFVDLSAMAAAWASWMEYVSDIAAMLSVLWFLMRMAEMVYSWIQNREGPRRKPRDPE